MGTLWPAERAVKTAATILLAGVVTFTALLPSGAGAQETRPPSLRNAEDLRRKTLEAYSLEMRRQGLVGSPMLSLTVKANGRAADPEIIESSGIEVLDRTALQLAQDMRFEPARNAGEKVDTSVRLPIEFRSDCGSPPSTRHRPDLLDVLGALDAEAIDRHSVGRPAAVLLDVVIDTAGRPSSIDVLQSSGLADADTLAVHRIAETRYEPVHWEGSPVSARFRDLVLPRLDVTPATQSSCTTSSGPRLTNRDFLLRAAQMVATGAADTGRPVAREATALLWVGSDGNVGSVYITEGTCWADLDDYLLSVWMAAEFAPASCDGRPISTYVRLPVVISE